MHSYVFSTSAFLRDFSDKNASYFFMSACRNNNSEKTKWKELYTNDVSQRVLVH